MADLSAECAASGGIWEGMAAVSFPDLIREETASSISPNNDFYPLLQGLFRS
jgi:hypothetical protein